jgi:hypothetical protein
MGLICGDEFSLTIMISGLQAHQKSLQCDHAISMASVITSFKGITAGRVCKLMCSLEKGAWSLQSYPNPLAHPATGYTEHVRVKGLSSIP